MKCAHCGFNASPRGKNYMSFEVFLAGITLAEKLGAGVFLGGGEPTDHPLFSSFVVKMLEAEIELEASGVITNGTNVKEAKLISKLSDVFYTAISLDPYHDTTMVSEEVKRLKFSDVRKSSFVFYVGRAKKIADAKKGHCICSELFLNWNGDLFSCGCKKEYFGNVLKEVFIPSNRSLCSCYKEKEFVYSDCEEKENEIR
jgi:hypothetical protein